MGEINICNSAGRDAVVTAQSIHSALKVRWVDARGRQAGNVRVLKSPAARDIDALVKQCGGVGKVAGALVDGDPEIDAELTGRLLRDTSRVYIDRDGEIVHKVQQ